MVHETQPSKKGSDGRTLARNADPSDAVYIGPEETCAASDDDQTIQSDTDCHGEQASHVAHTDTDIDASGGEDKDRKENSSDQEEVSDGRDTVLTRQKDEKNVGDDFNDDNITDTISVVGGEKNGAAPTDDHGIAQELGQNDVARDINMVGGGIKRRRDTTFRHDPVHVPRDSDMDIQLGQDPDTKTQGDKATTRRLKKPRQDDVVAASRAQARMRILWDALAMQHAAQDAVEHARLAVHQDAALLLARLVRVLCTDEHTNNKRRHEALEQADRMLQQYASTNRLAPRSNV